MADFVVLATADWDHPLWTNKQHTAVSLAELGHRVLYVESLGLRSPRPGKADLARILKRLRRLLRLPRQVRPGLWVWSPPVLPGAVRGRGLIINRWLVQSGLTLAQRWLGFLRPLLWTYNPLTLAYLDISTFSGTVYHCVDSIQDQPGLPSARITTGERRLCEAANVVFTTAPLLQQRLEPLNPHTFYFGNVADADHFGQASSASLPCPDALAAVPPPRLLFIGALDAYKLDLPLLEQLIRTTPQWSYVLVGPIGECDASTDLSTILALPNVLWPGVQPYRDLPAWLAHTDVALLPLQLNDYTRQMFPMKFFEYLASGRPTVATAIPSLVPHRESALLCEPTVAGFEAAIRTALAGEGPSVEERQAAAADHTYESRTDRMLAVLQRLGLLCGGPHLSSARTAEIAVGSRLFNSLLQRLTLQPLLILQRCRPGSAFRLAPWNTRLLERLVQLELKNGDWTAAVQLYAVLWQQHGTATELHRLMFRRGARPDHLADQIVLFEAIHACDQLPEIDRNYCRIVLAYRAIEQDNPTDMHRAVHDLDRIATALEQDSGTLVCQRPNRANRAKQLISCYATLLQLKLWLSDWAGVVAVGDRAAAFMDRFDPVCIDRETSYRMTRNIMRTLSVDVFEAWRTCDPERFKRARIRLERYSAYCHDSCHDRNPAQEDHRGFATKMMAAVACLEQEMRAGVWECDSIRELIVMLLANRPPTATEQQRFLELFPWYRPAPVEGR